MGDEDLEEICFGHLFHEKQELPKELRKEPYCDQCKIDKENKKCHYYRPVNISSILIKVKYN